MADDDKQDGLRGSESYIEGVRRRTAYTREPSEAEGPVYDVDVTPEGDQFVAVVRNIGGATNARTLAQLFEYIREVIVLMADLPDDAQPQVRVHYQWPEPGHPSRPPDSELFDSPAEMVDLMEDDLSVEHVRNVRGLGLI